MVNDWTTDTALALLSWMKAHDQRVSLGATREETELVAEALLRGLAEARVPYEWAREFVEHHYRQERGQVLQVGAIITAWQAEERRQEQARHTGDEERRCRFWRTCVCTHTECYDGWLDEERVTIRRGMEYRVVVRCPVCEEAITMAGELGGRKGGVR